MAGQLVFVPSSVEQARTLWQGSPLPGPVPGFTTTPALLAALEYGPDQAEDAEYAALVLASVASLARHGERLVLVAEVPSSQLTDDPTEHDNGGVQLDGLGKAHLQAFFTDADGVEVASAAAAAKGLVIDQAWEMPEVQSLLAEADLLWHSVAELAHLGEDV